MGEVVNRGECWGEGGIGGSVNRGAVLGGI